MNNEQVGLMTARELELLKHRGVSRSLRIGVSKPEISGPIFPRRGTIVTRLSPRIWEKKYLLQSIGSKSPSIVDDRRIPFANGLTVIFYRIMTLATAQQTSMIDL